MPETAYLVLENGEIFKGKRFGAKKEVTGELVFTTGMTGYVETLTDPSYYGQMIVHTFPLIGNYGVIPADFENKSVGAAALIVKDLCEEPSNFRSEFSLDAYLKKEDIPGFYDIDTRALTKIIRDQGNLKGIISDDPKTVDMSRLREYKIIQPVTKVSTKMKYEIKGTAANKKVAIIDFGIKENMKRALKERNCDLIIFPHDTSLEEIMETKPDGILLSNGPGDPKENEDAIALVQQLIKTGIPIFGICLGHQLLALAHGIDTIKIPFGHRGSNQPVYEIASRRVYMSSQNHGYAVDTTTMDSSVAMESFRNLNDGSCEGLEYKEHPIFSVQFHPEGCGGPQDTAFLFDKFIARMGVKEDATR